MLCVGVGVAASDAAPEPVGPVSVASWGAKTMTAMSTTMATDAPARIQASLGDRRAGAFVRSEVIESSSSFAVVRVRWPDGIVPRRGFGGVGVALGLLVGGRGHRVSPMSHFSRGKWDLGDTEWRRRRGVRGRLARSRKVS
jgi:hypothetical protein